MNRSASVHARIDATLRHEAGNVKTYDSMKDLWHEIDND